MKNLLFALALCCLCVSGAAQFNVSAKVAPGKVLAGEAASLAITGDGSGDMKFDLPEVKGINWIRRGVSTSQSYSSINGRTTRSITKSIYFTVNDPGEYEIPSIEVVCGKEKNYTAPVKFTVLTPGSAPGKSGNIPASARVVWPDTGRFYTGQWIPLQIVLTIPDGMNVGRYSFPQLSGVENLLFYNYSPNARKRDFGEVRQERTVYKDANATKLIFPAKIRAITNKVPDITGVVTIGIVRRDEERRDSYDGFFDSFFDRMNERIVPVNINIAPADKKPELLMLPDVPPGVCYLDIFGKMQLTSALSTEKCTAGEAAELILNIVSSDISQLKAPEIKIEGFRIYKPEVKNYGRSAEIRYCLIPLVPGRKNIKLDFASFDPETGKYLISSVKHTIEVLPSKTAVTSETPKSEKTEPVKEKELEESVKTPSHRTEPLYIKNGKTSKVHLNIWRNSTVFYLTGFVIMPLAALMIHLMKKRRNTLAMHPEIQLKRSLVKYACAILNKSGKTVLSDFEKQNIISASAAALGMEQGASASEIADKITDPELKEWFRKLDEASFNAYAKADTMLSENVRKKLMKLIRCSIILLFICVQSVYAGNAEKLFLSGKYSEAAAVYRSQLDKNHPSPQVLYNYGTCCINSGDLPSARAALLLAHKLAPRDEEIIENLNLVNRKLVQNEVNRTDTPSQLFKYFRDRLRPDEHLAASAVIFGIAMILLALNPARWKIISGVSGFAICIFIALMASQLYDSYAPHQAVTVPEFLELKQLPSDTPNTTIATVPGGSDAKVLQTRGDWMEIEVNGKSGWVKSDAVAFVTH